ncbi:MAG: NAD(P)H-hydrate dehydratase, partial [Verrucomicrobiota bacterium]
SAPEIQADRVGSLRSIAQRQGAVVVLKGHQTLVGESTGPVFVNPSGNPGLAQGGTGDVLAGYLVGLLAQNAHASHPVQTCRRAVWKHGAAADRLERRCRNWTAEELAEELGRV